METDEEIIHESDYDGSWTTTQVKEVMVLARADAVKTRDAELLKKHKEIINCVEQIKADIRYYLVKTRDEPLFYEELMGADGQVEFGLNKIKKLLSSPKPEEKKKGGRK